MQGANLFQQRFELWGQTGRNTCPKMIDDFLGRCLTIDKRTARHKVTDVSEQFRDLRICVCRCVLHLCSGIVAV